MNKIIELVIQPWAWYVAGPMITLVMFLLVYFGKSFGVSANLRTMCAIGGGGKYADFFRFEWKNEIWNLLFVLGAAIGGAITYHYLVNYKVVLKTYDFFVTSFLHDYQGGNFYKKKKI